MSTTEHTDSEPSERSSASNPDPGVSETPGMGAGALTAQGMASEWRASGIASLLLLGVTAAALLLLFVVLPIWDAMRARDGAWETYSELHSMSYEAGWKVDSAINSVQASLDGDLSSLDSGLWSVGFDLGSLAYEVEAESRPRVQELEGAIGARRDELRQLRRLADARFDQLRDRVEARLGGIEDAADAALDDHWDDSSRRFSRNDRIVMGWLGTLVAVFLALGLAGLWLAWRDSRALAHTAGRM